MNMHDPTLDYTPAVLVVGDSPAAIARATAAVVAAGLSTAARVDIAEAQSALDDHPLAAAVFVELDAVDPAATGARLEPFLDRLTAAGARCPGIVSTPAALIDLVDARTDGTRIVQLAEADDADRVAALATALRPLVAVVRDTASASVGGEAARLRLLTEEVGRIAGALARLSGGLLPPVQALEAADAGEADRGHLAELRRIVRARALRGRYFDPALFADPAWDMLLDLTAARIEAKPVAASSLCIAAAVPATTALRWIRMLTDAGLFVRRADPTDGRRVFIDLGEDAAAAMRAYLGALRTTG